MSNRAQLIEELLYSFHTIRKITKAKSLHLGHQDHITHSQWFVLTMIEHFEKTNIKELAEALDMSSSAATQLVDVLVQSDFVLRREDPEDRRSVQLELSPKGKKHIETTKEQRLNEMADIFDGLTDSELKEFIRLHKKITLKFQTKKTN
jgi:DNA-binding MarR family transcriptional regulator